MVQVAFGIEAWLMKQVFPADNDDEADLDDALALPQAAWVEGRLTTRGDHRPRGGPLAVGAETGEALGRLPLLEPSKDGSKADCAQINGVAVRDAGATTAARFLEHFVGKDKGWAHLDIAGPAFLEKSSGPYAAGATGNPMRAIVRWIEQLGA